LLDLHATLVSSALVVMAPAFFVVAAPTGQGQVLGIVRAAVVAGHDVFHRDLLARISVVGHYELGAAVNATAHPHQLASNLLLPKGVVRRHDGQDEFAMGGGHDPRVSSAIVRFTADESHDAPTTMTISGEAAGNAAAFAEQLFNLYSRAPTDASVQWADLPTWTAGEESTTPDLSSSISEIIDGAGWARGNALVLVVEGTGHRTAESFDGDANAAPRLEVILGFPSSP
jgi:hypothetical protein